MHSPNKDNRSSLLNPLSTTPPPGDGPGSSLPHVLIFGGQNTPKIRKLIDAWIASCAGHLPPHALSATEWPRAVASEVEDYARLVVLHGKRPRKRDKLKRLPRWLERTAARAVTALVAALDRTMRVDADGTPLTWLSRLVARYTSFSVDVLYNRGGLADRVLEIAVGALRGKPNVVVAHSFGGTIALAAAWKLWELGDRDTRFALVTLGTMCGHTVLSSKLFEGIPRTTDGKVALPPNVTSWEHCYSMNDALVAAPALPHRFDGVEQIEVDSGPFTIKGKAHALVGYLATPQLISSVHLTLRRASNEV